MIVLLGINDITFPAVPGMPPTEAVTADDLIWGFKQIVERAHAHGIKVAGATILPVEGVSTYTESGEAIRQAVNQWIRTERRLRRRHRFRRCGARSRESEAAAARTSILAITSIRTTRVTRRWRRRSMSPSSGEDGRHA